MSFSFERANPSIEEPSTPIPLVIADSSSSEVIATPFRLPTISENHSLINLTSLSLTLRNTKLIASESY